MFQLEIGMHTVLQGSLIPVRVVWDKGSSYSQLQLEIVSAGINNPDSVLGFGDVLKASGEHEFDSSIDTRNLPLGIFELKLVRFHMPKQASLRQSTDFIGGRDFPRQIFEVISALQTPHSKETLNIHIIEVENQLEKDFLDEVDIQSDSGASKREFAIFVFVNNLLLGRRTRFRNFEVTPFPQGMDAKDEVDCVNDFLQKYTISKLKFNYSDSERAQARQGNPVSVCNFPVVIASSPEEANAYAVEKTELLLLGMALTRSSSGSIFNCVVFERETGTATKFASVESYTGNLLTGSLAGENANTLDLYLKNLSSNATNRFFVGLYKEAAREKSVDFKYVRYWQIIEALAENRNYDPTLPLLDYENRVMFDGFKPRFISGSVNIVFNLLRETGIGTTEQTWKNVHVWIAFRNAVAHFGSIQKFGELRSKNDRLWAATAMAELENKHGHDQFLWNLREDVKLLLMRELALPLHTVPPANALLPASACPA